jgi:hypothetical protein
MELVKRIAFRGKAPLTPRRLVTGHPEERTVLVAHLRPARDFPTGVRMKRTNSWFRRAAAKTLSGPALRIGDAFRRAARQLRQDIRPLRTFASTPLRSGPRVVNTFSSISCAFANRPLRRRACGSGGGDFCALVATDLENCRAVRALGGGDKSVQLSRPARRGSERMSDWHPSSQAVLRKCRQRSEEMSVTTDRKRLYELRCAATHTHMSRRTGHSLLRVKRPDGILSNPI